jgi:hypothetical protein
MREGYYAYLVAALFLLAECPGRVYLLWWDVGNFRTPPLAVQQGEQEEVS